MLALEHVREREEADRCHLCGLPKAVCRAKSTERAVQVDLERCHVATAMTKTREEYERVGMPHMSGVALIPQVENPAAGLFGPEPAPPSSSRSPLR